MAKGAMRTLFATQTINKDLLTKAKVVMSGAVLVARIKFSVAWVLRPIPKVCFGMFLRLDRSDPGDGFCSAGIDLIGLDGCLVNLRDGLQHGGMTVDLAGYLGCNRWHRNRTLDLIQDSVDD